MLIIALVLALIGLVALVFAVVTSNELVAWVCIGASVLGVVLLVVDALRERQRREVGDETEEAPEQVLEKADEGEDAEVDYPVEYPEESLAEDKQDIHSDDPAVAESSEDADGESSEESTVSADQSHDDTAK